MSEHQPLLQIGTPLRDNDPAYVILRLDSDRDVAMAMEIINEVTEILAPLAVGLAATVSQLIQDGTAGLTGQLQAAGLNPVPIPLANVLFTPQPGQVQTAPPQPVYQPQAQASQAYAPPVQAAPPVIAMAGPCWASSRHGSDCKDCGGPTFLKVMTIRGDKQVNAHQCINNAQHKVTWCETPIWNSKKLTAQGQGIQVPEGLVYG